MEGSISMYEDNKDSSDSVNLFRFVERSGDEEWPAHLIFQKNGTFTPVKK